LFLKKVHGCLAGVAVGARKVTKMGAGTKVPTREEIIRFVSENNVELPDF